MHSPYMIDWAITNRCNLNCIHCRGMANKELDEKIIYKTANEIASLKPQWVIIEGGEPFLREELFDILEIISKKNIKIYLISNGMLVNEQYVDKLAKFGVKLMISIDGADKHSYEMIREGANFQKLKESVYIANQYNILDSCPITIGKHNYNQTDKLFQFVTEIGYKKITFIGIKPCEDYEKYVLNKQEYNDFFYSVIKNQKYYGIDVYVDEPFFKPFLKENNISLNQNGENGITVSDFSHCIFGDYMFIETNGDVKPCTFASIAIDNVNDHTLNDIWEKMQNSSLIKKIKDLSYREAPCNKCEHLSDCAGCRSRTYALNKNWFAADPSCPLNNII
ncbi:MAG: Antilisterial bacteriocin subtilosin biosynthesis protein AlbA [Bacteroidetes bacterium ADurb.Bin035]|nr:MAG: Antilisterial bacteriocin subtilosin biosynthesis protein AlbA [Bacteroidetes bacterium ADurb.Bin035]